MARVIDLYAVKNPECNIIPDVLLPILAKIKAQDAHEYRNIVKAICIYGDTPIERLLRMEKEYRPPFG